MTVNRESRECSDLQRKTIRAMELGNLAVKELDADLQIGGSLGEGIRRGTKKEGFVHSQVVRIREEDSLIGEDVADGLEKAGGRSRTHHGASPVFFSRPILSCSPLGGKASRRQGIALN